MAQLVAGSQEQKFFGSFFQKRTPSFLSCGPHFGQFADPYLQTARTGLFAP
jgi:hypothetical protein